MNLYQAKQQGITPQGNRFSILQDGKNSLHVTVQRGNYAVYEHFINISSEQEMMEKIAQLELELTEK